MTWKQIEEEEFLGWHLEKALSVFYGANAVTMFIHVNSRESVTRKGGRVTKCGPKKINQMKLPRGVESQVKAFIICKAEPWAARPVNWHE